LATKQQELSVVWNIKWQHFEKCGTCSWVCVNHCIWLVQLSVSMNNYFHSEENVDSGKICRKNQASTESKCDCATKYMMNAKVYLDKENNEVPRGLASDVDCILVQPISGQDRGGRNVTTDNFFTSFDLANQPKKKKLTLVGTMKQNKTKIPQMFKPARQRDENSSIFGFTKDLTLVYYVPKKNKSIVLITPSRFSHLQRFSNT